jgi:hypothetical protein
VRELKNITFVMFLQKAKRPRPVPKNGAVKSVKRVEGKLHAFLTSTLDRGEWSVIRYGCLPPGETTLGIL